MNSKSNQTSDENNLIIEPPLTWSVNSIQIVWSVGLKSTTEQHNEYLYNSEQINSNSISNTKTKNNSIVSEEPSFSFNPFALFGLISSGINALSFINGGSKYENSTTSSSINQWSESEKNEVSKTINSAFNQDVHQSISNQRLVFTVDFVNHTRSRLIFNADSSNTIPVYCGNTHIGDAHLINRNATIAATRKPIPCQFEMELNDTGKQCLLTYRPRIQVESGQLLIQSASNASEQYDDVIQESCFSNYFTVAILYNDQVAEWKIRWNKKDPAMLSQALEAINEYIRDINNDDNKTIFDIQNGRLYNVCGIPFNDNNKSELIGILNVMKGIESQTINEPRQFLSTTPRRGERYVFQLISQTLNRLQNDAKEGLAEAQYRLGLCYANGDGVIRDMTEAVKWYRKAAEQGIAGAQNVLGKCYANGAGVAKDMTEAVKWYRKAAEQGIAEAQNVLGKCYANGAGVAKDMTEAVKWYCKAAEQGIAEAQLHLGECYDDGAGVAEDKTEAVKWYRKAAEQGIAEAQNILGRCYARGNGIAQDRKEAAKWYQLAAEQGYAEAQYNLGNYYDRGVVNVANMKEAIKWFRKAADQGYAKAQCAVGFYYEEGYVVTKNYNEAIKWYRKAIEQDSAMGYLSLGRCYYFGYGVNKDSGEARILFHKSKEKAIEQKDEEVLGMLKEASAEIKVFLD